MSNSRISTIVFDAGGVLIYIRRRRNDIARGILLSMGYDIDAINKALMAGEAFDERYFENNPWIYNWMEEKQWLVGHYNAIARAIDEKNECLGDKLFMLTFDSYEYALYPEVIEVLESLKKEYKLGIISNALPSLDWSFDVIDIRKYFDSITISAYEGIEKPDSRIYIKGIERLGSRPEECIFIDDRLENVKAAESLGMKGLHLDRDKDTLEVLVEMLKGEFDVA